MASTYQEQAAVPAIGIDKNPIATTESCAGVGVNPSISIIPRAPFPGCVGFWMWIVKGLTRNKKHDNM